jgi:hypothetical protein
MTVPVKLTKNLAALRMQVAQASPLGAAPYATLQAIHLNAEQLETDTTLALYDAAGKLDTWVAPRDQPGIISGFQVAVGSALDEWRLMDMLASISRAVLNLELLIGDLSVQTQRTTLIPS